MSMTPRGYERFSTLSAEQQNILQQLIPLLLGQAQGGADVFEAPYKRQFEQEIIPGIAERFAGLGSGAQSSSAFQQALGQAGAGLSEKLAQLNAQRQQQGYQNLFNVLGLQTEGLVQKEMPFWQQLLLGGVQGASQAAGQLGGAALAGAL